MIRKKFRGISRKESDNLFRNGERSRLKNGGVYFLAKKEGEASRIAVSVSKKAAKNAVTRALFRRRIQAAVGPLIKTCKSADIMIVWATTDVPDVNVHKEELRSVFKKAGLIN